MARLNLDLFVEALRQQMYEQDETLPDSIARERGLVWLEGWFDFAAVIAAVDTTLTPPPA